MIKILAVICCLGLCLAPANLALAASAPEAQHTKGVAPEVVYASVLVGAEKGDVQSMLLLGSLYEQGIGTPRNFTSAMQAYEKAAFAGSADGYFRLGICHEVGMGTVADMAKAIVNYQKAAEMGQAQAQHRMASLYFTGTGLPKDEQQGFAFLVKAAEAGEPQAANELAYVYLKGLFGQKEDLVKARGWFGKSAENGHLEAMKNLAVMLKDGIGLKADLAASLRWYLIAQKGGLRAQDLQKTIDEIKSKLQAAQIKKAEEEADTWFAAFQTKMENKQQ
ncbi:sel1 repeat family protein [Desulfovibrio sp. OttesenSCG-928-M16]|nr:sel1 repeat family protein [Desulfovibrio sp. OttesenSCG-928-M16]